MLFSIQQNNIYSDRVNGYAFFYAPQSHIPHPSVLSTAYRSPGGCRLCRCVYTKELSFCYVLYHVGQLEAGCVTMKHNSFKPFYQPYAGMMCKMTNPLNPYLFL